MSIIQNWMEQNYFSDFPLYACADGVIYQRHWFWNGLVACSHLCDSVETNFECRNKQQYSLVSVCINIYVLMIPENMKLYPIVDGNKRQGAQVTICVAVRAILELSIQSCQSKQKDGAPQQLATKLVNPWSEDHYYFYNTTVPRSGDTLNGSKNQDYLIVNANQYHKSMKLGTKKLRVPIL